MAGFKLDANGDIEVDSNGKIQLLSTFQELVRQRLDIKLKTFRGEWFLDTTFGIPYRDTGDGRAMIGKGFTSKDIDAIYIATIKEDPDVISIEYFNSNYNPIQREYDLSFEVKTKDGILSGSVFKQAWEEETYEYLSNNISPVSNLQQWSLDIHPIVHEDMPEALQPPYSWEI